MSEEKYYSARLHTEEARRLAAKVWLETHPQPRRSEEPAAYWKWWRTYHFAQNDETWRNFVQRSHRPRTAPQAKQSSSSGRPGYRQPGHPQHEEFLAHARAYNKRYR